MSVGGLCKRVSSFGFTLLERGYALDAKPHIVSTVKGKVKSVSWVRNESAALMVPALPRLDDYLQLIRDQEYSYLMHDGAAVQILYQYNDSEVSKHRLLYWPCPFDALDALEQETPVIDAIETTFLGNLRTETVLRGLLRFDYTPEYAAELHPASHLTLSGPDCRIPVHAPLSFDTFMRFVLENFYPRAWSDRKVMSHLAFEQEEICLAASESERIHLVWQYVSP